MTDETPVVPLELAELLLEGASPVRLEVTLAEADLIVAQLSAAGTITAALLAEKVRLQGLPQAQEICQRAALLQARTATETEAPN